MSLIAMVGANGAARADAAMPGAVTPRTPESLPAGPTLPKRAPRYAVGIGVAGPTPRWAYVMQYWAGRWLVFDFAGGPSHQALTFSLGAKLRGPRLPIIQPFVGALVANAHRDNDGDDEVSNHAGARIGFDMRLPGDRWVLGVEVGATRPFIGESIPELRRFASITLSALF